MSGIVTRWALQQEKEIQMRAEQFSHSVAASLGLLLLGINAFTAAIPARAQHDGFPSRTITIIVPAPAGGSADSLTRALAPPLNAMTGHTIVVDNRPGAAGVVGARAVVGAPPDGHTLLSQSIPAILVGPNSTEPRPFDPANDLTPIISLGRAPAVLVMHPKFGIRTLPELIAYAKANPGKINMASAGVGTGGHFNLEMLKRQAGVDIVHVPYRGSPLAMTDLVGGHVDGMFSDASFFLEQIKAGTVVPLATAAAQRIPALPDVPTTGEQGYPNLLGENLYCLFAPAGTPPEVVRKLNALILRALEDPQVREAFARQSVVIVGESPEELAKHYAAEDKRWVPLVKELIPITKLN
jgi:tripartite-type tricarboxylate transporter receptor subunit TctC